MMKEEIRENVFVSTIRDDEGDCWETVVFQRDPWFVSMQVCSYSEEQAIETHESVARQVRNSTAPLARL